MKETYELIAAVLGKLDVGGCAEVADALLTGEDIATLPGVGARSIEKIDAAVELGARVMQARAARDTRVISGPQDVWNLMHERAAALDREVFWVIALTTKNRVIKVYEVSVGSLSASIVHPRECFKEAVRLSAASLVLVHNHPSGDAAPSGADIQLTRRLIKAGDVLGIEVLDHVVLGNDTPASLRDLGLM